MIREGSTMNVRGKKKSDWVKQCPYCKTNNSAIFNCIKCGRHGCWKCMPNGSSQACPECETGKSVTDHV
jgi:hypothetical protein